MIRASIALGVLLVALLALDARLASRAVAGEVDAALALLDDGERARVTERVAALKLRAPGAREPLLFASVDGDWRCLSLARAPASSRAIQEVVDALFAARGLVMTAPEAPVDEVERAAFGLGEDARFVLSFHGPRVLSAPDEDVLLRVRVAPGPGAGSFAVVVRDERVGPVLELDRDLARLLAPRAGSGLPALLDPHVVPASWSTRAEGPRRIRVARLGAPPYELVLEEDGRWTLTEEGGEPRTCHHLLSRGYTLFLARIPFRALLPRDASTAAGFGSPRGLVTVTPVQGDDLVLTLGDAVEGGVAVRNGATDNAYAVAPELVPLLLPEPEALLDWERGNPWDAYLRDTAPSGAR